MKSGLSRKLSVTDIGLPVIRANNINNGKLDLINDIKYWYVHDSQCAKTSNYLVKRNDILVNFINSESKMGTTAIVLKEPVRDTIYTTNIMKLKVNTKEYHPYFIFQQTLTGKYKNYIKIITKPAVNQSSFTTVDFKKYNFHVPNYNEQQKISSLLQNFDNLITLHQRKHHILGKLYSTFVDKVYPEKDKNTPMLRFNNYNREWDKTKLELLLEEFTIKSNVENEYQILSSTNTGMEFRNGRVSGKSNKGYKIIKNGDLVLSPQNLWLGNININNLGTGLVSPSYKTFHINKGDGEFLEPQLHTKRMLNTFENVSTQGASVVRRNLDIDLFNQIIIKTPQNDEKAEIASLLISIKTLNKVYEKN